MKIIIILMLAAAPASAGWGRAENSAAGALVSGRAEVSVTGGVPLLDLLGARDKAALPVVIGGRAFLASVVFDSNWDGWFTLKPAAPGFGAGAWKETDLALGAVYKFKDLELRLKETSGTVSIEAPDGKRVEIAVTGLFDRLYGNSLKVTFGGIVTYAVFRNLEPLSGSEGVVTLRTGSDGLYYYSVTQDKQIEDAPRWLLAVNGVLYGLRVEEGSLLFLSKPVEQAGPALPGGRSR